MLQSVDSTTHPVDVVMYHYVRPLEQTAFPRIKGLHVDAFERQLDWLTANTRIITMDEFLVMLDTGQTAQEPTSLLTFDDGLRDHVEVVMPALLRRGLTGAFYVPSAPIVNHELLDVHRIQFILASIDADDADQVAAILEACRPAMLEHLAPGRLAELQNEAQASRFDTPDVILIKRLLQRELPRHVRRELTAELFARFVTSDESAFAGELYLDMSDLQAMVDVGMHIGSHADTHEWLTFLDEQEQERELRTCLALLESVGSADPWTMAYPYGDHDDVTLAITERLSCAAAFTTKVGGAQTATDMRLTLPRYDTNDFPQ